MMVEKVDEKRDRLAAMVAFQCQYPSTTISCSQRHVTQLWLEVTSVTIKEAMQQFQQQRLDLGMMEKRLNLH
jgi:hypothetical protein